MQISSHFPRMVELSRYFKRLLHCRISKLKQWKTCEVIIFFSCPAYFFLSQIQKNITPKRQIIVVLSKVFSGIFKRKQKIKYIGTLPCFSWKCLVKGMRAYFSKNISNLDAECLRIKSCSLCTVLRYEQES